MIHIAMRIITTLLLLLGMTVTVVAQTIDEMEYWVDADPGLGQATTVSGLTSAEDISEFMTSLTADTVLGRHIVGFRSMGEDSIWSHTQFFQYTVLDPTPAGEIMTIEYFIDSDPGLDSATAFTTAFAEASDINALMGAITNEETLPTGRHFIGFRSLDSQDRWSHTQFVQYTALPSPEPIDIVAIEYYWSSDGGFDAETEVLDVPMEVDVQEFDFTIPLPTDVEVGDSLCLFARSKDEEGHWSHTALADTIQVYPLMAGTLEVDTTTCGAFTSPNGSVVTEDGTLTELVFNGTAFQETLYTVTITQFDLGVSQEDGVLTADQMDATYQWLDCDDNLAVIDGATDQTYTGVVNGSYAVEVTLAECVDTSSCITVVLLEPITVTVEVDLLCSETYELPDGEITDAMGMYVDTLTAINGADSIITTSVSVFSSSSDISITQYGGVYVAEVEVTSDDISYEWFECGTDDSVGVFDAVFDPDSTAQYYVEITIENCTIQSNCDTLTSITEELSVYGLSVYPNPTSDHLFIELMHPTADFQVRLLDLTGRLIMRKSLTQGLHTIDVSSMPRATYLLRFQTNEHSISRRIILTD